LPDLVVRDGSGRDLPESGELEVRVERPVSLEFDREAGEEVEDSYEGPWTFRFAI
jgi:hypothetical protein